MYKNCYTKKYKKYLIIIKDMSNVDICNTRFKCSIYGPDPGGYMKIFECNDFNKCIEKAKHYINHRKMGMLKKLIRLIKRRLRK